MRMSSYLSSLFISYKTEHKESFVCAHKTKLCLQISNEISNIHFCISQIFFGAIRLRNGWTYNPTCAQFRYAFRQLLIHITPDILRGNCEPQDSTKNICLEDRGAKPLNPSPKQHPLNWIENSGEEEEDEDEEDEAETDIIGCIREDLSVEELDNSFENDSSDDDNEKEEEAVHPSVVTQEHDYPYTPGCKNPKCQVCQDILAYIG